MKWKFPWARKKKSLPQPKRARRVVLRPEGHHYNLKEILEDLNEEYFEGKLDLPITWFGSQCREVRTHRTLGSYHFENRLIRINRLLDHPHFPHYFISYVVYHEMLHSLLPPRKEKRGFFSVHHNEFKEREKKFRFYRAAIAWERKNRKIGLDYGRPQQMGEYQA